MTRQDYLALALCALVILGVVGMFFGFTADFESPLMEDGPTPVVAPPAGIDTVIDAATAADAVVGAPREPAVLTPAGPLHTTIALPPVGAPVPRKVQEEAAAATKAAEQIEEKVQRSVRHRRRPRLPRKIRQQLLNAQKRGPPTP